MRVKKTRLDPETVVLLSDWLTAVARLMSLCFFSLFLPPFADRSGWNWFRLGLRQATFLPLVEHPKACGFSVAARSAQEKQQRRNTFTQKGTSTNTPYYSESVHT